MLAFILFSHILFLLPLYTTKLHSKKKISPPQHYAGVMEIKFKKTNKKPHEPPNYVSFSLAKPNYIF